MSRVCPITFKRLAFGNNVSHANNRTRRTFAPNLQIFSLLSKVLGSKIKLRLSARGLRTIEKAGGLDSYLARAKKNSLHEDLLPIKRAFDKAQKRQEAKN